MLQVALLRISLVVLALGLLPALAMVYSVGETIAGNFPEVAHLHWPVFIGVAIGLVPVLAGIVVAWQLVDVAELPRAAFSDRTLVLLRRLRLLILATQGYMAVGFVGTWILAGDMTPGVIVVWLGLEAAGLFAVCLVSFLERLFRTGIDYRTDSELTV